MLILTYSNKETEGQRNYEASLKKFGYNYHIVGSGQTWKGFMKGKIYECHKYLSENAEYDIIACTDCFDVIATGGPEELLSKFRSCGKNLIFGMETNCMGNCVPLDIENNENFRYVNAGFYIGYREDILQLWSEILTYQEEDDQVCLGMYFNRNKEKVYLDYYSDFVGNILEISSAPLFELSDDRIRRIDKNTYPVFCHFPGFAKHSIMGKYCNVLIPGFTELKAENPIYVCFSKYPGETGFIILLILTFLILCVMYFGLVITVFLTLIFLALLSFCLLSNTFISIALLFILFLFLVERYP